MYSNIVSERTFQLQCMTSCPDQCLLHEIQTLHWRTYHPRLHLPFNSAKTHPLVYWISLAVLAFGCLTWPPTFQTLSFMVLIVLASFLQPLNLQIPLFNNVMYWILKVYLFRTSFSTIST